MSIIPNVTYTDCSEKNSRDNIAAQDAIDCTKSLLQLHMLSETSSKLTAGLNSPPVMLMSSVNQHPPKLR